jgi:hypothetical protein
VKAPSNSLPDERPQPTREQLLQDIQAEAAEKKAELNQLRDFKEQARDMVDAEAERRVEDERGAFRNDLREAIKLGRKDAARQIEDLCNRYGRANSEKIRAEAKYLLARAGKLSRPDKVRMLRAHGIPEPAILDFLANDIHHMINSRGGPRDSSEVRIDAAKQLLNIKLPGDPGVIVQGLSAHRARSGGAAAANSGAQGDQIP